MAKAAESETVGLQNNNYSSCEDLRHLLTQLCEEVCFLRMTKKESEERVRHLVADQHKHERQLEEEILKNSSIKEMHVQELADVDRSYQDEIQHLKREKNKLIWENESWERNVKSVKDEVRTLQLEKYNLERMIREQSHCLKTHVTASSSHLKQATEIEANFKEIKQLVERCNNQTKNLSKEVKEAVVLNKRLSFINSHHNCEKRDFETKLEDKEKIICELQINRKMKEAGTIDKEDDSKARQQKHEVAIIQEQLRETKHNEEILEKQLDLARERNKEVISQYDEAQRLVEQFMTGAERHKNNVSELEMENAKLREELKNVHVTMKEGEIRETDLRQEIDKLKASISSNERLDKRQTQVVDKSTLTEEKCTEKHTAGNICTDDNQLQLGVHESKQLPMKNEIVLEEPRSFTHIQQASVDECIISTTSSIPTTNVTSVSTHSDDEKIKKITAFTSTSVNSNDGGEESSRKLDNFTKTGCTSWNNKQTGDGAGNLHIMENNAPSFKEGTGSTLLENTTAHINSKLEEKEMGTSDAGFANVLTEDVTTKRVNSGDKTECDTEISHTVIKANTSEVIDVTEEQTTHKASLSKNDTQSVTTHLSSDNVILGTSNLVKVSEKVETDKSTETDEMSDGVGMSKKASQVVNSNLDVNKKDTLPSFKGLLDDVITDAALTLHDGTPFVASANVTRSQVDQAKGGKVTFYLQEPITFYEGSGGGKPSLDQVKSQEEPTIEAKQNFSDPSNPYDSGNVICRAQESLTAVGGKISVKTAGGDSQNDMHEDSYNATTKLSQRCSPSNHCVDTITRHNFNVTSASQMVAESRICDNVNQTLVSFTGIVDESSIRQPVASFNEGNTTPCSKTQCLESEISNEDEKNSVAIGREDHDCGQSTRAKLLQPISPTKEPTENRTSLTAVTHITNNRDSFSSSEFWKSQEKAQRTQNYENSSQKIRIITPEKPCALYLSMTPNMSARDSSIRQCTTPSEETSTSLTIQPSETASIKLSQYAVHRPGEVSSLGMLSSVALSIPQAQVLHSERLMSPERHVVNFQNPVIKTYAEKSSPNISCQGLCLELNNSLKEAKDFCDMSKSAGNHCALSSGPITFPLSEREICAVSWSDYKGKRGFSLPTKVCPQAVSRSHVASNKISGHSKFEVKLHDVLKGIPGKVGHAVQVSRGYFPLTDDGSTGVGEKSIDHLPSRLGHKVLADGSCEMEGASPCDDGVDIRSDNSAVRPMSPGNKENSKSGQQEENLNSSRKRPALSQDPEMSLFSDDESEEDDISSTLTKEIERAQSILNRNRLKRSRRCKQTDDS